MLTAAQILGNATRDRSRDFTHRIVFAALAGEPWGLMGSRKLLTELQGGSNSTKGLEFRRIQQVVVLWLTVLVAASICLCLLLARQQWHAECTQVFRVQLPWR